MTTNSAKSDQLLFAVFILMSRDEHSHASSTELSEMFLSFTLPFFFLECVFYHTPVFIPVLLSVFTTSKSLHLSYVFVGLFVCLVFIVSRTSMHMLKTPLSKADICHLKVWVCIIYRIRLCCSCAS